MRNLKPRFNEEGLKSIKIFSHFTIKTGCREIRVFKKSYYFPTDQIGAYMKFGYFDDEKREYVIDRPDTPAPWANYLGSPEYGAVISNNAGGYSLDRKSVV